ncbi:tetratricopeptide repeat protein [Plantactinospora sp. WMMB782]|uniref:tetratricopeptide repeat protein n=1 Tax=Plantactinospora sp. WMMB782 TaxID=3404121 RepID=UPI003B931D59
MSDGDPVADFERACAWDSTGRSDRAVPLYRSALDHGLAGYRRRRAVIQMSSSLRNIGQAELAVRLLEAERELAPHLPRYQRSMANYARLLLSTA